MADDEACRQRLESLEDALRESEERFRRVLAAMAEGLVVVDHDLRVLVTNESAHRIFDGEPAEVVGIDALPCVLVQDEDGVALPLSMRPAAIAVREGRPSRGRIMAFARPGGPLRWLSVNCQPVNLPGEDGRGAVLSFSDVTERRAIEAERARLEEKLRQAQKMEALGTLASGIAHDFNNILAAIMGNVDLALMDLPQEHLAAVRLEEIAHASERGRDLVQRLLMFARLREPRRRILRVAPVIDDVVRLLSPVLPVSIRMERQLDDGVAVLADESELHQILVNLCTNAAAAIGAEPGLVHLVLERVRRDDVPCTPPAPHDAAEWWARLAVGDDGCGMDEATISRMFDPFFSTRPVGTGTGLGLSVVHGIVTGLGGCIDVRSAPGAGSTFALYLPIAGTEDAVPSPLAAAAGSGTQASGARVLFVDDDPALVSLGVAALERGGFRVEAFQDPLAALAAFREHPSDFALVITDVLMPGLSGLELGAEIRSLNPTVPLVLTSAMESLLPDDALSRLQPARVALKPWSHVGLVALARTAME